MYVLYLVPVTPKKKEQNYKLGEGTVIYQLLGQQGWFFFLTGKYDVLSYCLFDWKDD